MEVPVAGESPPPLLNRVGLETLGAEASLARPRVRRSNLLIVVEGCSGSGKSTVSEHLAAVLGACGFHFPPDFVRFRDETDLDLRVRAIPRFAYYLAAALELSDLVRDQLQYSDVVCDRYFASSMAPVVAFNQLSASDLFQLAEPFVSYLVRPDLVLLLTVAPPIGIDRIKHRARLTGKRTTLGEGLTADPEAFARCEAIVRTQAVGLPIVEIDTTDLTIDEVRAEAISSVRQVASVNRCRS